MAGPGVACGLLSIPLRYMHTPGEVVDLAVVEQSVQLLVEFARRVKKKQSYNW
jgi:endoglucanase